MFTAACFICMEAREFETEGIAKMAVVEHVYRVHPDMYFYACCINGGHGILCDGNHERGGDNNVRQTRASATE